MNSLDLVGKLLGNDSKRCRYFLDVFGPLRPSSMVRIRVDIRTGSDSSLRISEAINLGRLPNNIILPSNA